jgi:hypothetical protein
MGYFYRAIFLIIGCIGTMLNLRAQAVEEQYVLPQHRSIESFIQAHLWVEVELDRKSCYVGEPIVVSYYLYTRLRSHSKIRKRPSLNGFSVYDMHTQADMEPRVVQRRGQYVYQHLIRKVQLYASTPGAYFIDPVEVENTIQYTRSQSDSIDPSYAEQYQVVVGTEQVEVEIKALPISKDSNVQAVGDFSLLLRRTDQNPIDLGDPFVLELILEGTGNLALLSPPAFPLPTDWRRLSTATEDAWQSNQAPLKGMKVFRYTLLANKDGRYTISPLSFRYYNPTLRRFITAQSNALEITIGAAEQKSTTKRVKSAVSTTVGTTISPAWWLLIFIPVLFWVGWIISKKKRRVDIVRSTTPVETKVDWDALLFEPNDQQFVIKFYQHFRSAMEKRLSMNGSNAASFIPEAEQAKWQYWSTYCEQYLYGMQTKRIDRQAMIDAAKEIA